MDGLLVDSEPLWKEAEMLIFKKVNIILTPELCGRTEGLRIDAVVDYWHQKYPWTDRTNITKQMLESLIIDRVIELIYLRGKPLAGVVQAISFVQQKQVKIALASSSASKIIQAVLQKLNLTEAFAEVYSAESEVLGKPHPGVYLTTAHNLNVSPQECLALEDSLNGVLAAKAAQMKCLAIPDASQYNNPKFAIADRILQSLEEFNDDVWESLN